MPMDPELDALLDWTWEHKIPIMQAALAGGGSKGTTNLQGQNNLGMRAIYNQYSADVEEAEGVAATEDGEVNHFVNALRNLPQLNPRPNIGVQFNNDFRWLDDRQHLYDYGACNLKGNYIHFHKNDGACRWRVYINLAVATRGTAFAGILPLIWSIKGVSSAKVAAPGAHGADTMVIYCKDTSTQRKVINAIKPYREANPTHFARELPKMVKHETGAPGIGGAAEPPGVQPVMRQSGRLRKMETKQSFGMYRASLIFIALETTEFDMAPPDARRVATRYGAKSAQPAQADWDPRKAVNFSKPRNRQRQATRPEIEDAQRKREFKAKVARLFQEGGISVDEPFKQGKNKLKAIPK